MDQSEQWSMGLATLHDPNAENRINRRKYVIYLKVNEDKTVLLAGLQAKRYIAMYYANRGTLLHYASSYLLPKPDADEDKEKVEKVKEGVMLTRLQVSVNNVEYEEFDLGKKYTMPESRPECNPREREIIIRINGVEVVEQRSQRYRIYINSNNIESIILNLTLDRYKQYLNDDQLLFNYVRLLIVPSNQSIDFLQYSRDGISYTGLKSEFVDLAKHVSQTFLPTEINVDLPLQDDEINDANYTDEDYLNSDWGFSKEQVNWELVVRDRANNHGIHEASEVANVPILFELNAPLEQIEMDVWNGYREMFRLHRQMETLVASCNETSSSLLG